MQPETFSFSLNDFTDELIKDAYDKNIYRRFGKEKKNVSLTASKNLWSKAKTQDLIFIPLFRAVLTRDQVDQLAYLYKSTPDAILIKAYTRLNTKQGQPMYGEYEMELNNTKMIEENQKKLKSDYASLIMQKASQAIMTRPSSAYSNKSPRVKANTSPRKHNLRQLNSILNSLPQDKVLDVSDVKVDGTGARTKKKITEGGKSKKLYVPGFSNLVSSDRNGLINTLNASDLKEEEKRNILNSYDNMKTTIVPPNVQNTFSPAFPTNNTVSFQALPKPLNPVSYSQNTSRTSPRNIVTPVAVMYPQSVSSQSVSPQSVSPQSISPRNSLSTGNMMRTPSPPRMPQLISSQVMTPSQAMGML